MVPYVEGVVVAMTVMHALLFVLHMCMLRGFYDARVTAMLVSGGRVVALSVADIANPDLFACGSRTWISHDIARFYEVHCQPSSGSAW